MKKTIIFAVSLLALVACNKEVLTTGNGSEVGYISFDLSAEDGIKVQTKGDVSDFTLYSIFIGGQEYSYDEVNGKTLSFAPNSYQVYAENYTLAEAETGNGQIRIASPAYTVNVQAGQVASQTVECTPQSAEVKVVYDSSFESVFTGQTFTLKKTDGTNRADGKTQMLTLTEDTPVYWNVAEDAGLSLTYGIQGTHSTQGAKTYGGTITVKKACSYTITVTQTSSKGDVQLTITAVDTMTDMEQTITLDPYSNQSSASDPVEKNN